MKQRLRGSLRCVPPLRSPGDTVQTPIDQKQNGANGVVVFDKLQFEQDGVYNYIVREVIPVVSIT